MTGWMTRWRLIKGVLAVTAVAIVGLGVAVGVASTNGSDSNNRSPTAQDESSGEVAWLGVSVSASQDPTGALIERVVEDSPASDAALERDDVITTLDGNAVDGPETLKDAVRERSPGDEITLTIVKAGEDDTTDVDVTLGERPKRFHRFGGFGDIADRLRDGIAEHFDRILDASFRYLEDDGNIVEVTAVAGTIVEISDDELTIDTNEGDERSVELPDDTRVPGGLEADDRVIVVSVDGELRHLIAPGHFGGIPLPHFDLQGNGIPFCDEEDSGLPFEDGDLRDLICDRDFDFEPPEFDIDIDTPDCDGEPTIEKDEEGGITIQICPGEEPTPSPAP